MTDLTGQSSSRTPIVLAIAIFSFLSLAAAIASDGFLEADAITHYLYARFAFEQPHFFVNIWGRPICTEIYAFPALIGGRMGVRLMSLMLAIGCGWVAYRIARNQGYRWPALALIFTLAQPLVFLHSFSELTELPFAFLLGLGFLAFQTRRWLAFAILMGLTPLSRPEGFGFVILAVGALLIYRRWRWLPVLALPLVGWSYLGWRAYGSEGIWWRWLIDNWPYSTQSAYKPGPIWHFAQFLPVFAGPIIFPATCLGIWLSLRETNLPLPPGEGWGEGGGKDEGGRMKDENANSASADSSFIPHPSSFSPPRPLTLTLSQGERRRVQILIALIPLMILVGHSILYTLGKLGSNGELRYMLVVAPFWGLLSAKGWEWIFTRMSWQGVYRWAGVAALLPALANMFYRVVPLHLDQDSLDAQRAVRWYEQSPLSRSFPRIATAHQSFYYFMGIIGTDPNRALEWHREKLNHPTAGTIVFWHPMYSIYNSDEKRIVPLANLLQAGWIDITDRVPPQGPGWHVLLSPTDRQGRDAQETLRSLSNP